MNNRYDPSGNRFGGGNNPFGGRNPFGGGSFGGGNIGEDLLSFFGGAFGNSGDPYKHARNEYEKYLNQGTLFQSPFFQAGAGAIPAFQQWLQNQQNPSEFINNLLGQYKESPYARYQQEQGIRAGQNAASALGLSGSTPFAQFLTQQAEDISGQDINKWLEQVLGINTQYGEGVGNLIGRGQQSANALSNMRSQFGRDIAEAKFGEEEKRRRDRQREWGGLFNLGRDVAGLFI